MWRIYALALWLPFICSAQLTGQFQFSFTNNFPLWDFTGTYARSENGLEVVNTLAHGPNGVLTGTGTAHLNDGLNNLTGTETTRGKVSGGNNTQVAIEAAGKGSFSGTVLGRQVSGPFTGTLSLVLDPNSRMVSGNESATLCVQGYGCRTIATNVSFALPEDMTGAWTLTLNITTSNNVVRGTATAELSNGRTLSFRTRGRFRPTTGLSRITLTGTGEAFGLVVPMTLDAAGSIQQLRGKLFGQKLVYP